MLTFDQLSKKFLNRTDAKATLLQEGICLRIHLFARNVLVINKLEIEKNKPTFIISVLKVEY